MLAAAVAFAFGAVWGSFLNVCIHRIPYGLSLVHPPSRCPHCLARIAPYDNVPVLGYLWLRGRCRRCRMRISPLYPFVEAAMGIAFAALYVRHGLGWPFFYGAAFVGFLLTLAFIDWRHFLLPDSVTLSGAAFGLAGAAWAENHSFLRALLGAALGAGLMLAMYAAYYFLRRSEGMGLGDVKMMLLVGAFLGPKGVLWTLFFASGAGILYAAWLAVRRRATWQTALPYGTFLSLGALVWFFAGERIEAWYWRKSLELIKSLS